MTTDRRSDAFSRFYWIPVVIIGFVAWAVDLNVWIALGIGAIVIAALFVFDRLYYKRRSRGPSAGDM